MCYRYLTNHLRLFITSLLFLFIFQIHAQNPLGYSNESVINGVVAPMGTVFNESGTQMFIWTKSGKVFVANWISNDYVFQPNAVLDISEEVGDWRDFGLLSITLDPDFETNGWMYLFYVVDREHLINFGTPAYDPNDNDYFEATISRVTKYQIDMSSNPLMADYSSRTVLLGETKETGVPLTHESHAGGTLLFGTDGTLLVSTGDNASYVSVDSGSASETYFSQAIADGILRPEENVGAFRAQMITSLCGKVLRLDPFNGDGIPSNPHYDGANPRSPESRMYAMGLRNPFRMSIKPGSGSTNPMDADPGILFVADVGWNVWEDLHIFDKPGLNGGWPLFEGLTPQNGYQNTNQTNPDENNELFEDNCIQPTSFLDDPIPANRRFIHNRPEVAWRHGSSNDARVPWFSGSTPTDLQIGAAGSPTTGVMFRGNAGVSGTYITNASLGSFYEDKIFFSDYARDWIMVGTLTDGSLNWISDVEEFAPVGFGDGIVHMSVSPQDGLLYYANILNGTIRRITFEPPNWNNAPADLTVEADGTPDPGNAYANWLTSFDGNGSCGTLSVTNNSVGLSDDCGSTGTETVIFTLEDECGNTLAQSATFTIEDTTAPVFIETLPADQSVTCNSIPAPEVLTASDTAGSASVSFSETSSVGTCVSGTFTITRTWTATDECGNDTVHVQTLTVTDTTDPSFNEAIPGDQTVDCNSIPTAETLTATDDCTTATVVFSEDTTAGSCSGNYTITRTWTATDECGNDTVHVQTLTVTDTTDPSFNEALPVDISVECDNVPAIPTLTADDNCGSATVSFSQSTTFGSCQGSSTIYRSWTATDACGNETIHTQVITVSDTVSPIFNEALPVDQVVSCDNIPTAPVLTATDNCSAVTITFNETTSSGSCPGEYNLSRTWTATDECGNDTVHLQVLTVEDNENPVWSDSPTDQSVTCNDDYETAFQTWLNSFDGTDNCGSAIVTHDNVGSISCGEMKTIQFTLTDECGNVNIVSASFNVEDTLGISDEETTQLKIYPNPSYDYLIVSGLLDRAKLKIYDLTGKCVFDQPIYNEQEISLNLSAGLYLVKIFENNKVSVKRLVVK